MPQTLRIYKISDLADAIKSTEYASDKLKEMQPEKEQ